MLESLNVNAQQRRKSWARVWNGRKRTRKSRPKRSKKSAPPSVRRRRREAERTEGSRTEALKVALGAALWRADPLDDAPTPAAAQEILNIGGHFIEATLARFSRGPGNVRRHDQIRY